MTDGRRIIRNTLWNFAGLALPLGIAFVAVPIILRRLGNERFAILVLAWAAVGYFSLFDFGLPRVLTQAMSRALVGGDRKALADVSHVGLMVMGAMGVVGGMVLAVATPWLVVRGLRIPSELQGEAARSFYLLALCIPFVVVTAGLRGVMEAHHDFALATGLRLPYATFNFAAPLISTAFSSNLVPVMTLLVVGRVVTWALHAGFALRRYGYLREPWVFDPKTVRSLMSLGGWMTASNVISPLMYNVDRFVIGNVLSLAAVTHYVTPFELVTKLMLIPTAVIGVLFPAFAAAHENDPARSNQLLERALRLMAVVMFPGCLIVLAFAHEILLAWVGPAVATAGSTAAQYLVVGVFVNSVAQVAFTVFQSAARPDISAKIHVFELPLYVAVLWPLMRHFGISGVGAAWMFRMALDLALLLGMLIVVDQTRRAPIVGAFRTIIPLTAALFIPLLAPHPRERAVLTLVVLLVAGAGVWRRAMQPAERAAVLFMLRAPFGGTNAA